MPVTFSLYPRGASVPASLNEVDRLMCEHFGVEPDSKRYLCGWFDSIGFYLALGRTFETIRTDYEARLEKSKIKPELPNDVDFYSSTLAILEWLEANYSPTSGHEMK
jgi:hypothetical protein